MKKKDRLHRINWGKTLISSFIFLFVLGLITLVSVSHKVLPTYTIDSQDTFDGNNLVSYAVYDHQEGIEIASPYDFLNGIAGEAVESNGSWVAPPSSNSVRNPLRGNTSATALGKIKYEQLCAICHGKSGRGDGIAGMSLTPRPANFTSSKIQSQTDGALFWKLNEGRAPMAGYKTILKENERWQLINYLRTFKK